ncbi:glycosyltransferase family 2 protein [Marinobacter sp. C2H3]|uniref:glycosyltransferase family 2 protein n=1 Tax=Marinobacter sp. C2H3 TaxID=3119003 RepID=UPI00300E7094
MENQADEDLSKALSVGIVSYNSYDVIVRCLGRLIDTSAFSFLIVDNCSTDGSAQKLRERFPNATVLSMKQNLGYGRAANAAIENCRSPYFLLVNPDLMLSASDVHALLSSTRDLVPKPAIAAPAVRDKEAVRQGIKDKKWISGALMLFDLQQFKDIGFFDENIFLFSEETDLCFRATHAGKRIVVNTDQFVEHLKGQSSEPNPATEDLKNWHFAWSHFYFFAKHKLAYGRKSPYRMLLIYFLKSLFSGNRVKRRKFRNRFLGGFAFLRGRPAFAADGTPNGAHRK